jgi:hypothetical protein
VHVVTAGMHHRDLVALVIPAARDARIRQTGAFEDRQTVHVGAQQHHGSVAVAQHPRQPRATDALGDLVAVPGQPPGGETGGAMFPERQLRVGMKIPVCILEPHSQLVAVGSRAQHAGNLRQPPATLNGRRPTAKSSSSKTRHTDGAPMHQYTVHPFLPETGWHWPRRLDPIPGSLASGAGSSEIGRIPGPIGRPSRNQAAEEGDPGSAGAGRCGGPWSSVRRLRRPRRARPRLAARRPVVGAAAEPGHRLAGQRRTADDGPRRQSSP